MGLVIEAGLLERLPRAKAVADADIRQDRNHGDRNALLRGVMPVSLSVVMAPRALTSALLDAPGSQQFASSTSR